MLRWEKVDHFTGEPYRRSTSKWTAVDYVSGDLKIETLFNGDRELTKGGQKIRAFKSLKAAKEYAETI